MAKDIVNPDSNRKEHLLTKLVELEAKKLDDSKLKYNYLNHQIDFNKQRDQNLYHAHKTINETIRYKTKYNTVVFIVLGLLITIFLIVCVVTHQISFFIPFFKDLAYIVAGAFGGYGYGMVKSKRK